ncbi:unnamed protein product, partial [marine sediment metagenome]
RNQFKVEKRFKINGKFIIGYIGRLSWYEGIDILIKSIPCVLKKIQNIILVLIGNINKDYLKYLKQLSRELNISKYILLLSAIPHREITKYYSIIDIIVLPRLNLNVSRLVTPLKPLESMALKTLVIASDLPALRFTIKPEKTGDLFKAEDPEDLASKIIYYLRNPEKRNKIEEFARDYVEKNFSWKKVVPNYRKIYDDLLKNKDF